ncbi:MAG TPA: AIM24 family protein, partial [Tepidisphaeraceae bacterium]
MQFNISGTTMQTVSIDLQAGETIYSQRNVMGWMTDTIQMNTHTGGGLFKALKRSISGGGMFVVDYTATGPARIAFAARFP